jgi:hypothetical protein
MIIINVLVVIHSPNTCMYRKYLTNGSENSLRNTKTLAKSYMTSQIKLPRLTLTSCGLHGERLVLTSSLRPAVSGTAFTWIGVT